MNVSRFRSFRLPAAAAALTAALGAAPAAPPARVAGPSKMVTSPPFPPEAMKKNVEGNVVLSGEITTTGDIAGLEVLATSSPLLTPTARQYIGRWKFTPSTEGGKPVAMILNAVVRFRTDRSRLMDTGTLAAPIVGNFIIQPSDLSGRPTAGEGFAIEPGDGGMTGVLDLDLPKAQGDRAFHLIITDVFPSGKTATLLNQSTASTTSIYSITVFRAIDAKSRDEQGVHTIRVSVDGRDAGGARYRVSPGPPVPAKPAK